MRIAARSACRSSSSSASTTSRCFADADLIVAADGANSAIRARYSEHFQPTLDERPNLLAWYGTTQLFDPLSLIFRQNPDGLAIAHTYRYSRTHSTFLVEVDPATFRQAGLGGMSEADSLAWCEKVFADDLRGHKLLSNKSSWFRYTIVKNRALAPSEHRADRRRAAHRPSLGRVRHAPRDAGFDRALRCVQACGADVPKMLEEFVRIRQPGSDSLQKAAIKSTEWYENLGPKLPLDPISFAYDYVTRSGRVDHADVRQRDPELAAAYEKLHPRNHVLRITETPMLEGCVPWPPRPPTTTAAPACGKTSPFRRWSSAHAPARLARPRWSSTTAASATPNWWNASKRLAARCSTGA